jgi:tetratricopeptide (TPR) repeat protein
MVILVLLISFNYLNKFPSSVSFAESLYEQGDYFNSATEYERYLFYNSNDTLVEEIKLKLARAYIKSNEISKAKNILKELSSQEAQMELAELYIEQGELFKAKIELNDLLLFNNDTQDSIKKEAYKSLGNIALQEYEPNDAIRYFTQAQDSFLVTRIKPMTKLLKKNVLLSQILSSVIPGTGEMYCGKYGWGILSLLVNSASIYGTIRCYQNKQYLDAALILSFFFTRFYNGSHNNARDFAQSYNERIYHQSLKELNVTRNIKP